MRVALLFALVVGIVGALLFSLRDGATTRSTIGERPPPETVSTPDPQLPPATRNAPAEASPSKDQLAKVERVILPPPKEMTPEPEGPANDDYEPVEDVVVVETTHDVTRVDVLGEIEATEEERELYAAAVKDYELAMEEARQGTKAEAEGVMMRALRRMAQREIEIFGAERAAMKRDLDLKAGEALVNAMR